MKRNALAVVLAVALSTLAGTAPKKTETATFCGGCFWCMQPAFDRHNVQGVVSTAVGYTGGKEPDPTYEMVSSHKTGHCEAVQVVYDPEKISYGKLLDIFWKNIDPTTVDRQFMDDGHQYRTVIFYNNETQKRLAFASEDKLQKSKRFGSRPIVTEILPASTFYPAEAYHQKYYLKNSIQYKFYHLGSGRDLFFQRIWGNDPDSN